MSNHTELWKPVVGHELRYEVSNLGRVWSHKTHKVLSPGMTSSGYLSVQIYDGSRPKKPKSFSVHDLVAAAFIGPKPAGLTVDHADCIKTNNAAENLEYVSIEENCRRAKANGLVQVGERHWHARFTNAQVMRMRAMRGTKTTAQIAKEFGLRVDDAYQILSGKRYKIG